MERVISVSCVQGYYKLVTCTIIENPHLFTMTAAQTSPCPTAVVRREEQKKMPI